LGRRERAFDDNSGPGNNAKITFQSEFAATTTFKVILRSKSSATSGSCDIIFNGARRERRMPCGGKHIILRNVNRSEVLQSVRSPNGPNRHVMMVFKSGSENIESYYENEFISNHRITSRGNKRILVGSIVDIQQAYPFPGELLNLYVNDYLIDGHDQDEDDLGDKLEEAIGTCSDKTSIVWGKEGFPFDCACIEDERDTDQDGLADGIELTGKGSVHLPAWGSSPRHKDLFIEVDHLRSSPIETNAHMIPFAARNFAKIFADGYELRTIVQLANSVLLENPDRMPGIRAHLDIGIPPSDSSDVAIYGDWGGYTSINPVTLGNGVYDRVKASEAWKTNMDRDRLGLFRYIGGVPSGGGQCGNLQFACGCNFSSPSIPAHEIGHTLGLGHSGPHYEFDFDANCNPFYKSIMNYRFQNQSGIGFSSRYRTADFNNNALKERKAFLPGNSLLTTLSQYFEYYVDTLHGHVDWNRDGVFAAEGTTVRAYANYARGYACECTRYNRVSVTHGAANYRPAMARLDNRLFIFYKEPGASNAIKYRFTTSNLDCPQPETELCADTNWSDEYDTGVSTENGFDVLIVTRNESTELMLISSEGHGRIVMRLLNPGLGRPITWWSEEERIVPRNHAFEPALVNVSNNKVLLVYKDAENQLHHSMARAAANSWTWGDPVLSSTSVNNIISLTPISSPGLVKAKLAWNEYENTVYLMGTPVGESGLAIWSFDPNSNTVQWLRQNLFDSAPTGVVGRPGLAWVPNALPGNQGRLYLIYDHMDSHPRMMFSYVDKINFPEGREFIGLRAYFDNAWTTSSTSSIYYDTKGGASRLRYLSAKAIENEEGQVTSYEIIMRPKADGIQDAKYYGTNDWETLGAKFCDAVVNPDGLVSNPIRCK